MTAPPLSLLVLRGDGIGPEIAAATLTVLEAAARVAGVSLTVTEALIGFDALAAEGTTFPDRVEALARTHDGVILGPVSHNAYPPRDRGGLNPSAELRKRLDLYANIRPALTRAAFAPPCGKPFDLMIVRENTEGFYADRSMHSGPGELMVTADTSIALRRITRAACLRIARQAFELAATRPAAHVTAVHKANVLRVSDGMFLDCVRQVAADYPAIRYDEVLVDAMAAHLVRDAGRYDTIVTTNMFGDILSDLASELSGSLGLAPSLNAGTDFAMAQAQHGSAPDIAGQDIANPASLIGSVAMLMGWLAARRGDAGIGRVQTLISAALEAALADPSTRTADLGGPLGTAGFAGAIAARITADERNPA